jgi:IS30 family transposase
MVMRLQSLTLRAIAALLRRHPSTISREIRRHSQLGQYDTIWLAPQAGTECYVTRPAVSRLCSGSELFQVIPQILRIDWSP